MRSEALGASPSAAYASEDRGAGGKLSRRSFVRKPPSTPYDRPLTQQRRSAATAGGGGWMSKIVNPAYRLIAGGAAHLLRSVFSSSSVDSLPAPLSYPEAAEEGLEQGIRNENQESSIHPCMSKSAADEGPNEQEGRPDASRSAEVGQGKSHLIGDPDLSNIEQLIEGKTFCREEIDCLMGILQSRVVDAEGGGLISNARTTEEADKLEIPFGNLESTNAEKQETLDEDGTDGFANPTPPLQPTLLQAKEEIGASHIELAKAYMGSRALEYDTGSKSHVAKDDRLLSHRSELPSNRFLPPPSPKPSVCWPGAIVQEQHGYLTPHSRRGRYGLSNHLRSPYSRTLYSKAMSKLTPLEVESRISDISATSFQKQAPFYEELRIHATEDVQGSVGPIHRLRHMFVSENTPRRGSPSLWSSQKGSPRVKESSLWSSQKGSPRVKESSIFGDNFLVIKPIEPTTIGSSSHKGLSEAGTSVVHPQTSRHARQILEQISRTPTPKEMSEELKLVFAKKKSSTSEVSGSANDTTTASSVGGFLPDTEKESHPFLKVPSANLPTGGINGINSDSTSVSKTLQKSSFSFPDIRPSTTNQDSTQAIEIPNPNRGPGAASNLPLARNEEVNVQKSRSHSGTKPVLPPIFVDKSNQRVRFDADNCSSGGFTFPVAASSRSSEPPTPSIMPFSSAPCLNPPTYAFGEEKYAATFVFSFPWASNASAPNDTPQFKFGSEGTRVSFSSTVFS